jgi:restriction endonuclease Mrr
VAGGGGNVIGPIADARTPQELLEQGHALHRQSLASDVIARVKTCTPAFFEQLVVDLLVAMGYGGSRKDAGQAVGRSGDGGIDGIIKEDRRDSTLSTFKRSGGNRRWAGPWFKPSPEASKVTALAKMC